MALERKEPELALHHLRSLTLLEPDRAVHHTRMAALLFRMGKGEEAKEAGLKALELDPNAPVGKFLGEE